jgi:ParB/RepB/Spo0J family partition protein
MWQQRNGRLDVRAVTDAPGIVLYTAKSAALSGDIYVSETVIRYRDQLQHAPIIALYRDHGVAQSQGNELQTCPVAHQGSKLMADRERTRLSENARRESNRHKVATALPAIHSAPKSSLRILTLPIERLDANEYNPNAMTAEQFAELVAEIQNLERVPKPIVVRPHGDRWLIVDGEHGWRAARQAGLTEITCEVVDADDFEAMRQTYKRNQHGTHNPVRLGRMFQKMMTGRNLSLRELARNINVSEGTVRNAVAFAAAAELRNRYAPQASVTEADAERTIARLTIRQIRAPSLSRLTASHRRRMARCWSRPEGPHDGSNSPG